jgi:hypothetical protein
MSNPAAFLESELLTELGELVGNRLHGSSARPSERLIQRLRKRPGFVSFGLRAAGTVIGEWWSEGTDQWEAVTAGIHEAQSHVDAPKLPVNCTPALCLCHPPEPVDPRSDAAWRAVDAGDRRGVLGVQSTTGGGICEVNYMPSLLVHMIADGGRSLSVVERLVDEPIPPIRRGRVDPPAPHSSRAGQVPGRDFWRAALGTA